MSADRTGTGRSVYDVATAWQFDHYQIVSFAETLFEADVLDTARDVLDYMAKPWKYQPEWVLYHELDSPSPEYTAARWAEFVEKLEELA